MKRNDEILTLIEKLDDYIKQNHQTDEKYLDVTQLAEYLNKKKSQIYKMTHKRVINYYKPGGKKIYFKKSDIDNWIEQNKIKSKKEIEESANTIYTKLT